MQTNPLQDQSNHSLAADTPATKRLSINLPSTVFGELERFARQSNRSMTELVQAAFGLVKIAHDEAEKGHRLAVMDQNGKNLKEIVLIK